MPVYCISPKPPYRVGKIVKTIRFLSIGFYYRITTGQLWPRIKRNG